MEKTATTPSPERRVFLTCLGNARTGTTGAMSWSVCHTGPEVVVSILSGDVAAGVGGRWTFAHTDPAFPDGRKLVMELDRARYRTVIDFALLLCRMGGIGVADLKDAMESRSDLRALRDAYRSALHDRDEFLAGWPDNLTTEDREFITSRVTEEWPSGRWASIEHPEDSIRRLRAQMEKEGKGRNPWIELAVKKIEQAERARTDRRREMS